MGYKCGYGRIVVLAYPEPLDPRPWRVMGRANKRMLGYCLVEHVSVDRVPDNAKDEESHVNMREHS